MKYKKCFARCVVCNEFLVLSTCPKCSVKAKLEETKKEIRGKE